MHKVIIIYILSQREKRKGGKGMGEVENLPFPEGKGGRGKLREGE